MKLISLKLKNFKGIRAFELQANGENVSVRGDNATGKTTISDAFHWLLTGKDSQGKADFDIKTLDKQNQSIHGLEHEVEATFDIDGKPVSFRKVFYEQWTKKRGSAEREFTGHTTDYFINGVPSKKNEFQSKINEIAQEDLFRLLTNPAYFNTQLHWQNRRATLIQVCGDVNDTDVIESNKALKDLPAVLQGRTIDDHRKIIAARRAQINAELEKIPIRISEVSQSLPDLSNLIPEQLPKDIEKMKSLIQAKEAELASIKSGGGAVEKTKQLRQVEAELLKLETDFNTAIETQIQGKRASINQLEEKASAVRREMNQIGTGAATVESIEQRIVALTAEAGKLREDWKELNAKVFEFGQSDTCPTCGQHLPEEQLRSAREKALSDFNRTKAEQLESIQSTGKQKVNEVKKLESDILAIQTQEQKDRTEHQAKMDELAGFQTKIGSLNKDIEQLRQATVKTTPSYIDKLRQKEAFEEAIHNLQAAQDNRAEILAVQKEIEALTGDKETLEKALANVEFHKKATARIEELKTQERDLAAEYEKLEGELYMTEEFIRSKVNLLESKINSRFKLARFKLFETQINGGLTECCETLYDGVPYSSNLNTASRINVGIDIINVLSEHYGFAAPVFVDNAESVTQFINTNAQLIKLIKPEIHNEEDRKQYSKLVVEYETPQILKEAV